MNDSFKRLSTASERSLKASEKRRQRKEVKSQRMERLREARRAKERQRALELQLAAEQEENAEWANLDWLESHGLPPTITALLPRLKFTQYGCDLISDALLERCATLFSAHYGYWGPRSGKSPGTRIQLTAARLRSQYLFDAGRCYLNTVDDAEGTLISHAFVCRFPYEGGCAIWITQLVVHSDWRGRGIATELLGKTWTTDTVAWGLVSSHPYAVRALERMTSRRCKPGLIAEHAEELVRAARVPYMFQQKGAIVPIGDTVQLRIEDQEVLLGSGQLGQQQLSRYSGAGGAGVRARHSQSIAHTDFQLDLTDVDDIRRRLEATGDWNLGALDYGDEYFAFTFRWQDLEVRPTRQQREQRQAEDHGLAGRSGEVFGPPAVQLILVNPHGGGKMPPEKRNKSTNTPITRQQLGGGGLESYQKAVSGSPNSDQRGSVFGSGARQRLQQQKHKKQVQFVETPMAQQPKLTKQEQLQADYEQIVALRHQQKTQLIPPIPKQKRTQQQLKLDADGGDDGEVNDEVDIMGTQQQQEAQEPVPDVIRLPPMSDRQKKALVRKLLQRRQEQRLARLQQQRRLIQAQRRTRLAGLAAGGSGRNLATASTSGTSGPGSSNGGTRSPASILLSSPVKRCYIRKQQLQQQQQQPASTITAGIKQRSELLQLRRRQLLTELLPLNRNLRIQEQARLQQQRGKASRLGGSGINLITPAGSSSDSPTSETVMKRKRKITPADYTPSVLRAIGSSAALAAGWKISGAVRSSSLSAEMLADSDTDDLASADRDGCDTPAESGGADSTGETNSPPIKLRLLEQQTQIQQSQRRRGIVPSAIAQHLLKPQPITRFPPKPSPPDDGNVATRSPTTTIITTTDTFSASSKTSVPSATGGSGICSGPLVRTVPSAQSSTGGVAAVRRSGILCLPAAASQTNQVTTVTASSEFSPPKQTTSRSSSSSLAVAANVGRIEGAVDASTAAVDSYKIHQELDAAIGITTYPNEEGGADCDRRTGSVPAVSRDEGDKGTITVSGTGDIGDDMAEAMEAIWGPTVHEQGGDNGTGGPSLLSAETGTTVLTGVEKQEELMVGSSSTGDDRNRDDGEHTATS